MATAEPTGYENEPVEVLLPLPEGLYPDLYQLQAGDSAPESTYYLNILQEFGVRRVLELGCGTGRIAEFLLDSGLQVTGIDHSRPMLEHARDSRRVPVAQMDMGRLGFSRCFDAAIIPCNGLNLLGSEQAVSNCLMEVSAALLPGSHLVLQIFILSRQLEQNPGVKFFQFQLHGMEGSGKLVRETIRCYDPHRHILELEERYKLRPHHGGGPNHNYTQKFELAAFSAEQWIELFTDAGFGIQTMHSSIEQYPFMPGRDSTLFLTARTS
jgi:SAM-dependent methyltransferase